MSSSYMSVSVEMFREFHAIDRALYKFLVMNLWRDPVESMQVVALWLWLERVGFNNVVVKILSLPYTLINQLSDEAVLCINCIHSEDFLYMHMDIPLIQSLMDRDISLRYFVIHRARAVEGVAKTIREVCIRAFNDIMQQAIDNQNMVPPTYETRPDHENVLMSMANRDDHVILPPEDRTMFVTFSKGYPVSEREVRDFFARGLGEYNCIESLHMQEVNVCEQALFARIVFKSVTTIPMILNGRDKVKFNINGKHVWARKFVPKRPRCSGPPPTFAMPQNFQAPF